MPFTTDNPGDHAASSATSSPNSIIDRKREHKAIPGSFSYNLGRRGGAGLPPPLDLSAAPSPSRSVRSIVAWIESSAVVAASSSGKPSMRLSVSDGGGGALSSQASSCKLHGSLGSLSLSSSSQPRAAGGGVHVDSDCATFLDYQQYFATESLARCLDEQSSVRTVMSSAGTEGGVEMRERAARAGQRRMVDKDERFASGSAVADKRSPAEVAAL